MLEGISQSTNSFCVEPFYMPILIGEEGIFVPMTDDLRLLVEAPSHFPRILAQIPAIDYFLHLD